MWRNWFCGNVFYDGCVDTVRMWWCVMTDKVNTSIMFLSHEEHCYTLKVSNCLILLYWVCWFSCKAISNACFKRCYTKKVHPVPVTCVLLGDERALVSRKRAD